jgi:hypothetical protein
MGFLWKVQQSTFCPLPLLRRRIRLRCSFRRDPEALPYLAVGPALKGKNYLEILPERKYPFGTPKGSNCSNQKKPIYYIFVRCFLVWLLKIVFFLFLNEIKLHAKIQFEPKYAIINKEDSSIRLYIFK